MGFLDKLFKRVPQQPRPISTPKATPSTEFRYVPGELYYEAEALRKAGHLDKAKKA